MKPFITWFALPLLLSPAAARADNTPAAEIIGRKIPDFVLTDSSGAERALSDFRAKRAVAVVFLGTGCPIGNRFLPELNELAEKHADLQLIGINSNQSDSQEEIAAHAEKFKLNFPVLCDPDQTIADLFQARRAPEVFLLDSRSRVQYYGRISDRFGYEHQRSAATRNDLAEAVDELLAGKEVSVKTTEYEGCLISRTAKGKPDEPVTYAMHVSRIMQERCQSCHHPGTAAPFSLLTYQDAVDWAAMTKEVVLERRMPPWHADPRHGDFSNDRRLTPEEIKTLVNWIDAGTPLGDEKDLPPEKTYTDGWTIGKPDIVFELPEEVTIPAQGEIPYRYFETQTEFKEDVWVQAAEARPGNRAVVHHIIVFYRAPNDKRGDIEGNWIAATAPGDMPLILPAGVGRKIPAGSKLIWQMHYTPTGKEEKDRSQIGLVFYKGDGPPEREALTHGIANHRFKISPGANNHQVDSKMVVPRDALLLSFMPHMHLRGKDFEYQATFPDGRKQTLLSVPRYDFNWQSTYRLKEPLLVPRGTLIECTAHFDNSSDNPANPDPTKEVRWGDQTWEEMMIGYVDYMWAEVDSKK